MYVDCRQCPLRRISAFRPLEGEELDFVRAIKTDQIAVAARAAIISTVDDHEDRLFTIYSGWAFRYLRVGGRGRQIVDILLPGDLVALQSPLTGKVRHCVESITPTSLCRLDGPGFRRLFEELPALAEALTATLLLEESRADRRLMMLGRLRPTFRLAYALLELQDRLSRRGMVNGDAFDCPLTYELLSDLIGVSRAQLGASLKELRARGWASLAAGQVQIGNPGEMADAVGYAQLPDPELRALI